jgi:hypothetical protein
MVKMKTGKAKATTAPAVVLKKPKPKKAPKRTSPKVKRPRGLTNAELRELAAKYPPPQSWFDEDLEGLC